MTNISVCTVCGVSGNDKFYANKSKKLCKECLKLKNKDEYSKKKPVVKLNADRDIQNEIIELINDRFDTLNTVEMDLYPTQRNRSWRDMVEDELHETKLKLKDNDNETFDMFEKAMLENNELKIQVAIMDLTIKDMENRFNETIKDMENRFNQVVNMRDSLYDINFDVIVGGINKIADAINEPGLSIIYVNSSESNENYENNENSKNEN